MISQDLIEENKKKLLEEKDRLEKLLSKVAQPNLDVAGDYKATYPDFGDDADENATEVSEYETNIAEEKQLEEKLKAVVTALSKIEDGTYGVDPESGEDISEDRLRAVPEALSDIKHDEE